MYIADELGVYITALESLTTDTEWAYSPESEDVDNSKFDYSSIIWGSYQGVKPSLEELQLEAKRIQAEYDANEYSRLRKEEYNKLNQYELQFDDLTNGTNTWEAAILEIKAKYPKGVL